MLLLARRPLADGEGAPLAPEVLLLHDALAEDQRDGLRLEADQADRLRLLLEGAGRGGALAENQVERTEVPKLN